MPKEKEKAATVAAAEENSRKWELNGKVENGKETRGYHGEKKIERGRGKQPRAAEKPENGQKKRERNGKGVGE